MGFQWEVPPNQAFPDLMNAYTRTIFQTGRRVAHQRAQDATAWMKENAPWEDQTGRARAGLHVDVEESEFILAKLIFSHDPSLDYTVWLEIAHGGRYSIIPAAIDYWGAQLMTDLRRMMNLKLIAK